MSPKDIYGIAVCMDPKNFVHESSRHKIKTDIQGKENLTSKTAGRLPANVTCENCEARTSDYLCAKDINVQSRNMELLSQTNWYHEGMSSRQAKSVLSESPNGTFLIRDSSDPNFLFSVSVKTPRGPTSVRVLYSNGLFQLDCDSKLRTVVPKFETVVALVDHYVRQGLLQERNRCRWLERSGRKDLPIELKQPKVNDLSSLKHLCRLTINRSLPTNVNTSVSILDALGLPKPLANYLKDYPHLH